jgi:hypothetical protein
LSIDGAADRAAPLAPQIAPHHWRRRHGRRRSVRLFPVRIAALEETPQPATPSSRAAAACCAGSIEIELGGDVRVRVDENVRLVALRRVVVVVLRG